jgi:parallel beta-helix repeat protein
MRKIIKLFIAIVILFQSNIAMANNLKFENNFFLIHQDIVYVDKNNILGPWYGTIEFPYKKINEALENCTKGSTIYVFEGIYKENIFINKSIILEGENKKSTIIDGQYQKNVININAENTRIFNFSIENSGGLKDNCGLEINSNKNFFNNLIISRTKSGLFINNSENNIIDNCTFHTNAEGIYIKNSKMTIIQASNFIHNSIGVNIKNSFENEIIQCYSSVNGVAYLFDNTSYTKIYKNNISDNCANLGGIFLVNSNNISLKNSILNHNGIGINIYSSDKIKIEFCDVVYNTHFGIALRSASQNIEVSNCNIYKNIRYGIFVEKENEVKVKYCNIRGNRLYGIYSNSYKCTARLNWWGSQFGPSYSEFRNSSKISLIPSYYKFIPWIIKPIRLNGASWHDNPTYINDYEYTKPEVFIKINGTDSDADGAPDWWEIKWEQYHIDKWEDHKNLDPDNDGLNNLEECYADKYGSNPFKKDIFLELDWMESQEDQFSNKPDLEFLEKLVKIFEEHDIIFHYDIGNLDGGEEIPFCNNSFSFAKLRDLYWSYFLHNNLNNQRKGIFRYGIICSYCPDLNFPFMGWDQLDGFAISAKWLKENNPLIDINQLIIGAIVHQLGHTLGLLADTYDGIDNMGILNYFSKNWWKYKNYKSCMNYLYKYRIFSYSDGTHGYGDFDDWGNINLSFFKNTNFFL